jgi:hypothetical protein
MRGWESLLVGLAWFTGLTLTLRPVSRPKTSGNFFSDSTRTLFSPPFYRSTSIKHSFILARVKTSLHQRLCWVLFITQSCIYYVHLFLLNLYQAISQSTSSIESVRRFNGGNRGGTLYYRHILTWKSHSSDKSKSSLVSHKIYFLP